MSANLRRGLVVAVTFAGFLDTHLLIPILALYAADLGATVFGIGLIVGVYSVVHTPLSVVAGVVVDRYGRKAPLLVGLAGDALAMLLYSVAATPSHLFLVRLLHGVGGATIGPATMSLLTDLAPSGERGKVMAIYGMSLGAAVLVGYGASGVVASRFGYPPLFFGGAAVLVAAFVAAPFLPSAAAPSEPTRPRRALDIVSLLRRRRLIVAYQAVFAQYFGFGGLVVLLPLHLRAVLLGEGAAFHVAILLMTAVVVYLVVQLPGGAISDRVGRRGPMVVGLALAAAGLAVVPLMPSLPWMAMAMAVHGLGWGLLFPSASALLADGAAPNERGAAAGVFHALITAGVAVGAPVMGAVAGWVGVPLALALTPTLLALGVPLSAVLLANAPNSPLPEGEAG